MADKKQDEQKVKYPEMLEYPWAKDMDRVVANSKSVVTSGDNPITVDQMPKVPINLLLAVMKECMSRPEVMEAWGSAPLDGQIPKREAHLLMWHQEYLTHKYGSEPNVVMVLGIPMRKMANDYYTGLDDPKLVAELMKNPLICEDDGENYEQ